MEFEHITVPDGIDVTAKILPQREVAGDTVPILHGIDVLFLAEAALERVYFAGGTVDLESAQTALGRAVSSAWLYYIGQWLWEKLNSYLVRLPGPLEAATDVLTTVDPDYYNVQSRGDFYHWDSFPSLGFTASPEQRSEDAIEDELTKPSPPSAKILGLDELRYYFDVVKRMNYRRLSITEEVEATYTLSCEKEAGSKDFLAPDDPVAPNVFEYDYDNSTWYGGNHITYEYYYHNKAAWSGSYPESYGGYVWQYLFERSFYACGLDLGAAAEYLNSDNSDIVVVFDFCVKEAVLETQGGKETFRTFKARKSVTFQRLGNALTVSNGELCAKAREAMAAAGVQPRTDCWTQRILVYHESVGVYCGLRGKTRLDKGDETTA